MTLHRKPFDSGARATSGDRMLFLDGLRGLAAAQVVFRHYVDAFLPGLGTFNEQLVRFAWERASFSAPLFFLNDGEFWMDLFFVISGAVLTTAQWKHPVALGPSVVQRIVRLGGPMAIALTVSALLVSAAPQVHVQAGLLAGPSQWLASQMSMPKSAAEVVRQALSTGMLTGYRETSLLPRSMVDALALDPVARSLDAPLWSLHLEFWGSIAILALTAVRRRLSGVTHAALVALLAVVLSRHVFLAFLFGHLFAMVRASPSWPHFQASRFATAVGLVALLLGIAACANPRWGWMTAWFALPNPWPVIPTMNAQGLYAAIVFFSGVVLFPPMRAVLLWSPFQWLGRNSFGLYLFHFPILFTAASATFVALQGRVSYGEAVLGAAAVGVPLSLAAAAAFTAWVNPVFVGLGRALARVRLSRVGGTVAGL